MLPTDRSCVLAAWEKFLALDLPSEPLLVDTERQSGNKAKLLQRVWEMMLARHLDALGVKLTTAPEGPDFRL